MEAAHAALGSVACRSAFGKHSSALARVQLMTGMPRFAKGFTKD
jgi:hypothetical protein